MYTKVKTADEIVSMRESGRQLAIVLEFLKDNIQPGLSTRDIASLADKKLKDLGGKPAFLGYYGFPDIICISINDEIVHGIPGEKIVRDGDIVSLDFGVSIDGMITDSAISVVVGTTIQKKVDSLLKATEEAMYAGISVAKGGVRVGLIANSIENVLKKQQLGIVKDLVGHGVGHQLHEEPNIPNYGLKNSGPILKSGMTIAIEPMATLGSFEVETKADGWTIASKDHSLSAHFEHTILITDDGAEILTRI